MKPGDEYRALLQEILRFVREVENRPETSIPPSLGLDGPHLMRWKKLLTKIRVALKGESSPN